MLYFPFCIWFPCSRHLRVPVVLALDQDYCNLLLSKHECSLFSAHTPCLRGSTRKYFCTADVCTLLLPSRRVMSFTRSALQVHLNLCKSGCLHLSELTPFQINRVNSCAAWTIWSCMMLFMVEFGDFTTLLHVSCCSLNVTEGHSYEQYTTGHIGRLAIYIQNR